MRAGGVAEGSFCCSNPASFITAIHLQSLHWRKICPGFDHKSLSFGTGWSSLHHSSLSFSISRVDYICGEQQQRKSAFFHFLLVQGLQCCLSDVVTLIIWQLTLELQSQHVLSLLLAVWRDCSSFLLSFFFSYPCPFYLHTVRGAEWWGYWAPLSFPLNPIIGS